MIKAEKRYIIYINISKERMRIHLISQSDDKDQSQSGFIRKDEHIKKKGVLQGGIK